MGNRLSKIYTRTGDRGETGLAGGRRVPKSHPRIEAIGAVDELNSQLGLLLAELLEARGAHPGLEEIVQALAPVQHRLFDLGGELAMPEYRALDETEVARLESCIDRWNDELRIPRHSDTQPTLIRTPVPRSFGQAVGAQRRRGGIVSPGWLAS
ncbi:hypothetical protein FA571_23165, partial [Pseudomonas aeruginosa]|nr:hypothetical protein [Pseudomonas aeruginosa]